MVNLVWFLPHPTHYHSYLFDRIVQEKIATLEVVYFESVLESYPWQRTNMGQAPTYVLRKGFLKVDWNYLFSKKRQQVFLIAGWSEPTLVLMLSWHALTGKKYILFTDTPRARRINNSREVMRHIWLYYVIKCAAAILVTGEKGRNLFKRLFKSAKRVYQFPFVTDLTFFTSFVTPAPQGKLIFFSSGRLDVSHKGYDVAIQALGLLKLRAPTLQFVYKIAGTGPDKSKIEDLIRINNLQPNVSLLGWREVDELPRLYNESFLFIHPANCDPYPNAVLEAMACGCVVLASDSTGSAIDRIEHGRNGFIFRAGDQEELYQQIRNVTCMEPLRIREIKRRARETSVKWSYEYNMSVLREILE